MDTYQRSTGNKDIDWISQDSAVLLNPVWPEDVRRDLVFLSEEFPLPGHIWIASSGTSAKDLRSVKLIALSKQAFLVAAQAANEHLQSHDKDIWLNALPVFHVGGQSIYARAFLSGAKVISIFDSWNPEKFHQILNSENITLASLVPTQVFDLVTNQLKSPPSLRAVIVGGGALAKEVYLQALDLGWPLLPSYGLTECCSQVATAELSSLETRQPKLKILSHIQANQDSEKKLKIKSPALLSGFARWESNNARWNDPTVNGWFVTEDYVELKDGYLIPRGRGSQYIKILGEGISLFRLQEIFEAIVREEDPDNWIAYALISLPHPRRGNELVMLHSTCRPDKIEKIFKKYNSQVLSIEKLERILAVSEIPRTDLGKIKYELLQQILNSKN